MAGHECDGCIYWRYLAVGTSKKPQDGDMPATTCWTKGAAAGASRGRIAARDGRQSVTLEQLEQYEALVKEKRLWEAELNTLHRKYGGTVKDTVRGSSAEYPYTSHPVTITGVQTKPNKRILQKEARLKRRRAEVAEQLEQIEQFIDGLEDSQLRQIIHYRFVKGYSWVKTANLIGGKNTSDAIKKRVYRFFGKSA